MERNQLTAWIRGSAHRSNGRVARLAIVLFLAGLAAIPPAQARCDNSRPIATFGVGTYAYIYTPGCSHNTCGSLNSSTTDDAQGSFWAIGDGDPVVGSGIDNGSLPFPAGWGYIYPEYPTAIFSDWDASLSIDGCIDDAGDPARCMAALVSDIDQNSPSDPAGAFALMTDLPDGLLAYRFDTIANPVDMETLEAPMVTQAISVGGGTGLALTVDALTLPDIDAGLYLDPGCDTDLVQGYQMYWRTVPSGDPAPTSRNVGDWTASGPVVPLGTAGTVTVSCATLAGADLYLARGLVFESDFVMQLVSRNSDPVSTCEGAVAVPGLTHRGRLLLALTLTFGLLLLLLRRRLRPGSA